MGIKQCALVTAQLNWYNARYCPTELCRPRPAENRMLLDERKMPCKISTDLLNTSEIGGRGQ